MADWASTELQEQTRFYDDNTQVAWSPVVGGANIVELNKVLEPFSVALGGGAWEGASPSTLGLVLEWRAGLSSRGRPLVLMW